MKLKDILVEVPHLNFSGNGEDEIQGIAYSSKNVGPGFVFAALKGVKKDGFEFIAEALAKGAVAVLCEKSKPANFDKSWIQVSDAREALSLCSANFYSHPSDKMKVVGITGTKGKTTVTYLLEAILLKSHFQPAVIGTISYRGPGTKMRAERTTPEAPDLQKILKETFEHGATHCLIEVSSHSLELKRVLGIGFDVSVFTNLSGEHLDFHQSMENYYQAKKKLFFLNHKKRMAVINLDDRWGKRLISELGKGIITYGLEPGATVRGQSYKLTEKGIELSAKYPAGEVEISSPLLGKANLYNILASAAVALTLGIAVPHIQQGIASLQRVPGRFERIQNSLGINIFVDYAHTDDALRHLLETFRGMKAGRIILVFGAGGDRDKAKRPRMGEVAGALADWTIVTSDNPRSEDPLAIISNIEAGIKKTGTKNYQIIPDREKAIEQALSLGEKGDYVLVAGKGHENYQMFKDKTIPFDDAEVIRKILEKRSKPRSG